MILALNLMVLWNHKSLTPAPDPEAFAIIGKNEIYRDEEESAAIMANKEPEQPLQHKLLEEEQQPSQPLPQQPLVRSAQKHEQPLKSTPSSLRKAAIVSSGSRAKTAEALQAAVSNAPAPLRRARILVGIISSDSANDKAYRKRHRQLFQLWNDTRVCSIDQWENEATRPASCELIYTFVIGGNKDPNAPTEIVDDKTWPVLATKPIKTQHDDVNGPDTTLLNIRYVSIILGVRAALALALDSVDSHPAAVFRFRPTSKNTQ